MTAAATRPSRRRAVVGSVLRWVLILGALALSVRLLGDIAWADLAQRLRTASPAPVVAAAALLLARTCVWAWRWRLAARRAGPAPSFVALAAMVAASATVNHLVPTARVVGGLLRGRYLARATGLPLGRAFGSVLYDQLAHQVTLVVFTVAVTIAAAFVLGRPALGGMLGAAGLLVLGVAGWALRRSGGSGNGGRLRRFASAAVGRLAERGGRAARLLAHGRESVSVVGQLTGDGRLALASAGLGVLFAVVSGLAQVLVFAALGSEVSWVVALAVVCLGAAAGILLGTPGGIGATEAAMIAAFAATGMDRLDATAATLLFRGLHYLSVLVPGIPALLYLEATYGGRQGGGDHHSPVPDHH